MSHGTTIQPFIQVPRAPLPIAILLSGIITGDLVVGHVVSEDQLANVTVCENTEHDVWNDPLALVKKGCGDCADLVRAIGATRGTHVGCAPVPTGGFHVVLGTALDEAGEEIEIDDVCVSHGSVPFGREVYEAMVWWPIVRPVAPPASMAPNAAAVVALPLSFDVEIWAPLEEIVAATLRDAGEDAATPVFLAAQVLTQMRLAVLDLVAGGASPSSAIAVVIARTVEASNAASDAGLPVDQREAIDRAIISLETMANGSDAEIQACSAHGNETCQATALLGALVARDLGKARAPSAMARSVVEGAKSLVNRAVATAKRAMAEGRARAAAEAAARVPRRKPGCGGSCSAR